jgi:hypothetical protein
MPLVGLSEAARLTGKAHTTIHRAMNNGRLSFTKDEAGERRVDTTELDRVFGVRTGNGAIASDEQRNATHVREIELLTQQLADRDATIRHLRELVDREAEERRQLLALLTDQRSRSWWRRWFR